MPKKPFPGGQKFQPIFSLGMSHKIARQPRRIINLLLVLELVGTFFYCALLCNGNPSYFVAKLLAAMIAFVYKPS